MTLCDSLCSGRRILADVTLCLYQLGDLTFQSVATLQLFRVRKSIHIPVLCQRLSVIQFLCAMLAEQTPPCRPKIDIESAAYRCSVIFNFLSLL